MTWEKTCDFFAFYGCCCGFQRVSKRKGNRCKNGLVQNFRRISAAFHFFFLLIIMVG